MADFCAKCATDIGIPVSTGEGFCERCTKPLPPDDMWERIWVDPEYSEFRCDKLEPSYNHTLYVRADLYADLKQQRDELLECLKSMATSGVDDFGGSYVNLQVGREELAEARQLIQRCEVKE